MVHDDGPTCVMTDSREYEICVKDKRSMRREGREGRVGRAALWRQAAAELAGAALLLLLTCLPARDALAPRPPPAHSALAAGLTVALVVQCFDHISGAQLNPAVTLARALGGHESAARALLLAGAQLAGALLGAAAAAALGAAPAACLTRPADRVPPYQAAAVEAALGGCLALANLAAWDARTRRLRDSWPLRIGLAVAALTFAAGEISGASMNPVRSFAPALLAARWEHQWVYWVGPLSGSCVCTALYRCVWRAAPCKLAPCGCAPCELAPCGCAPCELAPCGCERGAQLAPAAARRAQLHATS